MDNLTSFLDKILIIANQSCTECLISELGDENSEIGDSIARLQLAYERSQISPDYEQELAAVLADFMTRVVTMAVFTGELMHRPGVRWLDQSTEIALPIVANLN